MVVIPPKLRDLDDIPVSSLPKEITNNLLLILKTHEDLMYEKITLQEFWHSQGTEAFNEVMKYFRDNAMTYNLSSLERQLIDDLVIRTPSLLEKLSKDSAIDKNDEILLRMCFDKGISFVKQFIRTYPHQIMFNFQSIKEKEINFSGKKDEVKIIISKLYDLLESLHYIRHGVLTLLADPGNEKLLKMSSFAYVIPTQKLRQDYSNFLDNIKISFPNLWNEIYSEAMILSSAIEKLEEYLVQVKDKINDIRSLIDDIRNRFKELCLRLTTGLVMYNRAYT